MTALAWGLLMALLASEGETEMPTRIRLTPAMSHPAMPSGQTTGCSSCHKTSSWAEVKFNHEPTGFPLTGFHQKTSCKSCHEKDFQTPLPRTCRGCHEDVHSGDLGFSCEGCHDTSDWKSRFDVDVHRRSNFPLVGAHAAIPCLECHRDVRERRFSRTAVECVACHMNDTLRTVGKAVDHLRLGLSERPCRECHQTTRFSPARFPAHDRCFPISAGPHAGVPCLSCHTQLTASSGQCDTRTANLCVDCHNNRGGSSTGATDVQHKNVPGYSFTPAKCAECHVSAGGRK